MANKYSPPPQKAQNAGRMILLLGLLIVAGILIYRKYWGDLSNYTSIPKEFQLTYKPADFEVSVDPEDALAIMNNPQRYRREFDELVYTINMSILKHVTDRMGLDESIKAKLKGEYEKHHAYLKNLYYNDFIALQDSTSAIYQAWYDNQSANSVEVLNQVAAKYTCFLVTHVITSLVKTNEAGSIYAKGQSVDTPCGIAIAEALQPMLKRMEERAAIEDFSRSRGLLQEKVERAVAELATMEVRDKKGLNKQLQTKIWGFSVSSSDIEITAISILKVGFRLNDYFDVSLNAKTGTVTVTLPEPQVLSHEVYPKIDKLDIGWLREVKGVNLNQSFNILREEFRREAIESDIMEKAKTQATELMDTLFGPMISSMNKRYKLKVRFRESSQQPAEEERAIPRSRKEDEEQTLDS
ncbi:MAG: DUF4230 domain-containing protein [Saprospiraceae bacterium]|nr:DUF4230 domain-containing protein [Saprospiraceae bacterium]